MRSALLVVIALCGVARAEVDPQRLAREVSQLRGLPLKRPIESEVIDRAELRRRLVALAAEDKTQAELASEALALARWGMIARATRYEALLVDLLSEQIAGYYDPGTAKLTLPAAADPDPGWAELVLAHELQHALQDQTYDLDKLEDLPGTESDALVARRALVEGDGVAVMIELMLRRAGMRVPWTDPQLVASVEAAMVAGKDDALARAPLAIREAMLFPYRAGFQFVAALRQRQPWSAVDAAFRRPPRSTEQILHPAKYLADEAPQPVTLGALAALPGYAVAHDTVWGELGFSLLLRSHRTDARAAAIAAAGWGGDRMIVLARPGDRRVGKAIGIARLEWDTEVDAIEAAEAAGKAIDAFIVGAVVDQDDARIRWFALDGTLAWVERRERTLIIVVGAPLVAADAIAAELWASGPGRSDT